MNEVLTTTLPEGLEERLGILGIAADDFPVTKQELSYQELEAIISTTNLSAARFDEYLIVNVKDVYFFKKRFSIGNGLFRVSGFMSSVRGQILIYTMANRGRPVAKSTLIDVTDSDENMVGSQISVIKYDLRIVSNHFKLVTPYGRDTVTLHEYN